MNALRTAALAVTLAGILMILFARPLAVLYEGPAYTMSDLGFIAGGTLLAGIGAMMLFTTLAAGAMRHFCRGER